MVRLAGRVLLLAAVCSGPAFAQGAGSISMERQAYADWLVTSTTSPMAAVAMHRLGGPVTIGPDTADIPLAGFGPGVVSEQKGAVYLTGADGKRRALPRGRPVAVSPWTLQVLGTAGRSVLLVYGKPEGTPPGWYPADDALTFSVSLDSDDAGERRRVLALDGIEVEARVAGYISVPVGRTAARLQVMRMPIPGTEETELQVYFRDLTNDHGSYPAGRFVELIPSPDGRYRIDFNRARNPFCAYSSVYPCPVPWTGNGLPVAVAAGEKYLPSKPLKSGS